MNVNHVDVFESGYPWLNWLWIYYYICIFHMCEQQIWIKNEVSSDQVWSLIIVFCWGPSYQAWSLMIGYMFNDHAKKRNNAGSTFFSRSKTQQKMRWQCSLISYSVLGTQNFNIKYEPEVSLLCKIWSSNIKGSNSKFLSKIVNLKFDFIFVKLKVSNVHMYYYFLLIK